MKNLLLSLLLLLASISLRAQNTWSEVQLPVTRIDMGIAVLGTKVYIAGGFVGWNYTERVDIYDLQTGQLDSAALSTTRAWPTGFSVGSKVFFAGGHKFFGENTVDILDTLNGEWSLAALSEPRFSIAALSRGNLAILAGGTNFYTNEAYATVDIYDAETNTWSVDSLSQGRSAMGYTLMGNKAFFAGGVLKDGTMSNRIDIFDFDTRQWDTASLSIPRGFLSGASSGTKAIFAGGMLSDWTPTDRVDIYDTETGNWSVSAIAAPRGFVDNGASACGKAFFIGGSYINIPANLQYQPSDLVDIYDAATDSWTVEHLNHPVFNHGVTSIGNKVIYAGGTSDLSDPIFDYSTLNIYSCSTSGTDNWVATPDNWQVSPNPSAEWFLIRDLQGESAPEARLRLIDMQGRIQFEKLGLGAEEHLNVANWAPGSYLLEIFRNGTTFRTLVWIVR